jgi:diphthamide synthase (EF-2-diphthine--ammonia ligase)
MEDIRQYRERMLEPNGITPIFPIWQRPTNVLAQEMIASGFKAVVTCIDPKQLPASFAGRRFDQTFLNDLPKEVDPCGERGEFHTFVYAGPVFQNPINIKVGEIIEREGFIFTDINSVEDEKSNKMGHRNDIS